MECEKGGLAQGKELQKQLLRDRSFCLKIVNEGFRFDLINEVWGLS